MFGILVLCGLVAASSALDVHAKHCCTLEDRREVHNAWESVWSSEFTGRRATIAKAAFLRYATDPS